MPVFIFVGTIAKILNMRIEKKRECLQNNSLYPRQQSLFNVLELNPTSRNSRKLQREIG